MIAALSSESTNSSSTSYGHTPRRLWHVPGTCLRAHAAHLLLNRPACGHAASGSFLRPAARRRFDLFSSPACGSRRRPSSPEPARAFCKATTSTSRAAPAPGCLVRRPPARLFRRGPGRALVSFISQAHELLWSALLRVLTAQSTSSSWCSWARSRSPSTLSKKSSSPSRA